MKAYNVCSVPAGVYAKPLVTKRKHQTKAVSKERRQLCSSGVSRYGSAQFDLLQRLGILEDAR